MVNAAWIAPDGKIYPVAHHTHGIFARKILGDETCTKEDATLKLARQGWLHIGLSPFVSLKPYTDINDAQIKALFVVLEDCTSGIVAQNIESYIHA
jgi:hypothetical protein